MRIFAVALAALLVGSGTAAQDGARRLERGETEQDAAGPGTTVSDGEVVQPMERYPYFASFFLHGKNCGGSLIHPRVVLTAAHCVPLSTEPPLTKVDVGRWTLDKGSSDEFDNHTITETRTHPDFNASLPFHTPDFALVLLEGAGSAMAPVLLAREVVDEGAAAVVMGNGLEAHTNTSLLQGVLKQASITIANQTWCGLIDSGRPLDKDGNIDWDVNVVPAGNFTVCGAPDSGKDCQGDSGGPLIVPGGDAAGDVQIGVVSYGRKKVCDTWSGYGRVSWAIDWIEEVLLEWALYLPTDSPTVSPAPTDLPSVAPSVAPSELPSVAPTLAPTLSSAPSTATPAPQAPTTPAPTEAPNSLPPSEAPTAIEAYSTPLNVTVQTAEPFPTSGAACQDLVTNLETSTTNLLNGVSSFETVATYEAVASYVNGKVPCTDGTRRLETVTVYESDISYVVKTAISYSSDADLQASKEEINADVIEKATLENLEEAYDTQDIEAVLGDITVDKITVEDTNGDDVVVTASPTASPTVAGGKGGKSKTAKATKKSKATKSSNTKGDKEGKATDPNPKGTKAVKSVKGTKTAKGQVPLEPLP